MRTKPNIVITGTPGVGKTIHSDMLARSSELEHLPISHLVKERGWHEGWDSDNQSWIVDEDKVGSPCCALNFYNCKIFRILMVDFVAPGCNSGRP